MDKASPVKKKSHVDVVKKLKLDKSITAEFLVSSLYRDAEEYTVFYEGDSNKDYNGELLNIDYYDNTATIHLARNGMMSILPEGLLFEKEGWHTPNKTKKELIKDHNEKKEQLQLLFEPIDRELFLLGLELERVIDYIENNKDKILVEEIFDKKIFDTEENDYVKKLFQLLPGGHRLKGDIKMLAYVAKTILGHDVRVNLIEDKVLFTVTIDNLDTKGYLCWKDDLKLFFDRLHDWFMPFDCNCEYAINASKQDMTLGNGLILDYNTKL